MSAAPPLNDEQRRAVEYGEGPLLVLAGPGTGKTSVLVSRVARLVERGVSPERVLALTFSRRAADELRDKLVSAGAEYGIEVGEHRLSGRHDVVIEESGERTLVRVSTSRSAASKADAASDPELALAALGSGADRARLEYPRHFAYGGPARRPLDTAEGWREAWRSRVDGALSEIEAGEFPPRPASEALCDRCEFKATCPLHAEEEPWLR